jgi:hypothetical protein
MGFLSQVGSTASFDALRRMLVVQGLPSFSTNEEGDKNNNDDEEYCHTANCTSDNRTGIYGLRAGRLRG